MKTIFVTGGAGFIGGNFVLDRVNEQQTHIVNIDKLTYAGNLDTLQSIESKSNYTFVQGDICDQPHMETLFKQYQPAAIVNFAAESHVDRSIEGPLAFIHTNVVGTSVLLEVARQYWLSTSKTEQQNFRFLHVSTDEVYGTLGSTGKFTEQTPYAPNSPYSASKASSDHIVRSYYHTYGFPVLTTNCSNNYGPYQFPEKLIPLVINKALRLQPIPIYGDGSNIRDWLYVQDHCNAIQCVLEQGKTGEVYNIGGNSEKSNLEVVHTICEELQQLKPSTAQSYRSLIQFVNDRPGHDLRYAIDASKIKTNLGWEPRQTFEMGIKSTIQWYLDNAAWCERVQDGSYRGERLGAC